MFNAKDMKQIELRGMAPEQIISQIEMFKMGAPYLELNRPCAIGDGIRSMSEEDLKKYTSVFERSGTRRGLTKFVPASGAASRMFKTLLRFNNEYERIHRDAIASEARQGEEHSQFLLRFINDIRQFAFYDDLKEEAERVFKELPVITPATYNGRPAYVQFTLPLEVPLVQPEQPQSEVVSLRSSTL